MSKHQVMSQLFKRRHGLPTEHIRFPAVPPSEERPPQYMIANERRGTFIKL